MKETTPHIALVTGASRGIGAAIAMELAHQGFVVIGTATTDEGAAKISHTLAAHANCRGVNLNVNDAAAVDALVEQITTQHKGLHVLVNNAGITRDTLAKVSRVMPALLTNTCKPLCCVVICSTKASTAAASFTLRLTPRQFAWAAKVWEILAAPSSVVAVPITTKPWCASSIAIAAPIPREAPVTKAMWGVVSFMTNK